MDALLLSRFPCRSALAVPVIAGLFDGIVRAEVHAEALPLSLQIATGIALIVRQFQMQQANGFLEGHHGILP